MPIGDFLFEGKPPPSTTTYGQSVEGMPKWMSDYTQGLIARANVIGAEPYQAYEGPRIAGFSPEEEEAFGMTKANIGAWQPYLGQAGESLSGGLTQAGEQIGAGTRGFPSAVGEYMDPYIQHVLDRQASLSQRQMEEQFLPGLQGAFTRAGHFGSDRMMDMGIRGARDISADLQQAQLGALSQAYGQAGELYGADAARNLQAAGLEGELGIRGAQEYGRLGEFASRMGYGDAAAMEAVGRTQRGMGQQSMDLAYQDFMRQQNYPRETIDWMSGVIRGLPSERYTQYQQTGPADIYQPSPLSQLASVGTGIYGLSQMGG
jgi:hypothetical protein